MQSKIKLVHFIEKKTDLFLYMYVSIFPVCAPSMCQLPVEVRRDTGSPGNGVTDSYEFPQECQELNLGPAVVV